MSSFSDEELHAKVDLILIDLATVKIKLDELEKKDKEHDAELEKVARTPAQLMLSFVSHPLFKDVVRVVITAALAAAATKGL